MNKGFSKASLIPKPLDTNRLFPNCRPKNQVFLLGTPTFPSAMAISAFFAIADGKARCFYRAHLFFAGNGENTVADRKIRCVYWAHQFFSVGNGVSRLLAIAAVNPDVLPNTLDVCVGNDDKTIADGFCWAHLAASFFCRQWRYRAVSWGLRPILGLYQRV